MKQKTEILKYKCGNFGRSVSCDYLDFNATLQHKDADSSQKDAVGIPFSIKIRRKLLLSINKNQTQALAFLALVRAYEKASGRCCTYTVNQLHELTGIHAKTIEKRLLTLESMGLMTYENKRIKLLAIRSKHNEKNVVVNITLGIKKSLKDAEKQVMSARVVNKLKQKDFFKTALNQFHDFKNNPNSKVSTDEFKKLSRWLREHCKTDFLNKNFIDYGWSYKKIAEYLDVSLATAVDIIKYAIEHNLISKKINSMFKRLSHSSQVDYLQHTFSFHGYSYKVWANSYSVIPTGTI